MSITAGVGKNAANQKDDVLIVQALLNLNLGRLTPLPPLVEDGDFGRFSQAYIVEFQKRFVPADVGTDAVRPGSATLAELLKAKTAALTAEVLEVLMPLARHEQAQRYFQPLIACMAQNQIDSPLRQAHFLAQLGHESGSLRFPEEIASGAQYEGRADLGNTQAGDGIRFKGRGLIQITGRLNYTAYGKARSRDFISGDNPKLLASDPLLAADCSGWYWNSRGLNAFADKDDVRAITLRINGGFNGLDDRVRRLKLAKMLAALIVFAALLAQDPSDPAFVATCDPCKVAITPSGPTIEAHFLVVNSPEGRVVRRIALVRDGKQIQELAVAAMTPVAAGEQFMFGGVDINFDGNRDLMLVLERGVANSTAEYWLYDPASQTFKDAGVHPVFTLDPARKRLKTYERGGSGGLIFSAREYEFQSGRLTLMRDETQRPTRNPNLFQHTIRERRKGAMVTVRQETIPAPAK